MCNRICEMAAANSSMSLLFQWWFHWFGYFILILGWVHFIRYFVISLFFLNACVCVCCCCPSRRVGINVVKGVGNHKHGEKKATQCALVNKKRTVSMLIFRCRRMILQRRLVIHLLGEEVFTSRFKDERREITRLTTFSPSLSLATTFS